MSKPQKVVEHWTDFLDWLFRIGCDTRYGWDMWEPDSAWARVVKVLCFPLLFILNRIIFVVSMLLVLVTLIVGAIVLGPVDYIVNGSKNKKYVERNKKN
jgi:hypothetical protein